MTAMRRELKPEDAARRLVELWQDRPRWQRTSDDIGRFYGWLNAHQPELLPARPGSFQKVCDLLAAHLKEDPRR
jgi:hypothetical protein